MKLKFTILFLSSFFFSPLSALADKIVISSKIDSGFEGSLVDTRDLSKCLFKTVKNAVCLPTQGLIGKNNIISIRDFYWLLSVSDLDHNEDIIVFGDNLNDVKFLAGLLFLSGQKNIHILDNNIGAILKTNRLDRGVRRNLFRTKLYKGKLREEFLDFRSDMTPYMKKQNVIKFVNSIISNKALQKVSL